MDGPQEPRTSATAARRQNPGIQAGFVVSGPGSAAVVNIVRPVTEVLDEKARIIGTACDLSAPARMGEIRIDPPAQYLNLVRLKQLANAYSAVALKSLDVLSRSSSELP